MDPRRSGGIKLAAAGESHGLGGSVVAIAFGSRVYACPIVCAVNLGVSSDALIFEAHERGPDDDLRLQFEAAQRLDPDEKQVAKTLLESLMIRHEASRWGKIAAKATEPTPNSGTP